MRTTALLTSLFLFPLGLSVGGCLQPLNDGPPPGDNPAPGPGPGGGGGGGSPDMATQGPGPGPGGGISGSISSNASWDGLVNISGGVTIESGVTVTVNPGAMVQVAANSGITVKGSLIARGTTASPVLMNPAQMGASWGGVIVQSGGSLDLAFTTLNNTNVPITCNAGATKCTANNTQLLHYSGVGMQLDATSTFTHMTVENGGSDGILVTNAAADVNISDSTFHMTGGDAIRVESGNLTFVHNKVYGDGSASHGQHCACHFDGTGTFIVTANDFTNSVYGFMVSGLGALSKVNGNNFSANDNVVSATVNAAADLSGNYWGSATPPTITGNTTNQGNPPAAYSPTLLSGTGPR